MATRKPTKANASAKTAGRCALISRTTNETQITMRLAVDGQGRFTGTIGVPFFEHMLNLFTRHAHFDLHIEGRGDLEVDAHHTVEDAGIVLGQALREALGDKAGMARYGTAYVPMEETLARCVLDVCNRPYLRFDAQIPKTKVGEFDAELCEEFMRAFCVNAGITMHITVLHGANVHHILEAIFKAVGRALGQAVARDPRIHGVFSTKGAL
ncbi:MAG: imidazoleglycerol-phosphate dehydratase HisB [Candidatus Sumerlaeaceae bacterium]|nr:imidazoleglycerol-phosphate dehydratase HisB [Candidatus Sumerlaeaceae bacterium]